MKNKKEQGSITLFVTMSCFFVMMMLIIFMMNMQNKKQVQNREIQQIVKSYEVTDQQMEESYSKIVNE